MLILRFMLLTTLLAAVSAPTTALASYQMFCEMRGEVSSTPTFSTVIEFEFRVAESREIDDETLGISESDCHLFDGKTIAVALEADDASDTSQIRQGAPLELRRYEIDVIVESTGEVVRSIKHVRIGNQSSP